MDEGGPGWTCPNLRRWLGAGFPLAVGAVAVQRWGLLRRSARQVTLAGCSAACERLRIP